MKDLFLCTCGFESNSEANAMRHAFIYHAKDDERIDPERLKVRIRTMIYTHVRDFSFDQQQSPVIN
jgi:hypothetical protein